MKGKLFDLLEKDAKVLLKNNVKVTGKKTKNLVRINRFKETHEELIFVQVVRNEEKGKPILVKILRDAKTKDCHELRSGDQFFV